VKRNIITINEELCIGCGQCVNTCHQGALQLVDGKARLISESYCDGLGFCLPECPSGALKVMEKNVEEFTKKDNQKKKESTCPSARAQNLINRNNVKEEEKKQERVDSQLAQWPVQIKLLPPKAPFLDGAKLLIAADCTAFANANIHTDYMKGKITMIGCPKLDQGDYADKFEEIFKHNEIKSVTVLRMSVPCCGGLEYAVKQGLVNSGKMIPWQVITLDPSGNEIE